MVNNMTIDWVNWLDKIWFSYDSQSDLVNLYLTDSKGNRIYRGCVRSGDFMKALMTGDEVSIEHMEFTGNVEGVI